MSNFSEFHDWFEAKEQGVEPVCSVCVVIFRRWSFFSSDSSPAVLGWAAAVTHDQLPLQQSVTLPWSAGRWMMGKHSGGSCNASVTVGVGVSENLKSSSVPSFVPTKCLKGIEVNRGLFYMCLCDEKLAKLYSEIWEGQLPNSGEGKRLVQVFVFCLRDLLDCSCHYIRDSSLDSSLSTMSIICLHLMFKQPQTFLLASSYLCLEKVETSHGSIDSTVSIHREWVSIHHCQWIDTPVASLISISRLKRQTDLHLHRYLSTGGIT